MKTKGQASLEFIFLILVIIIYIFTVTKPISQSAIDSIQDVQEITQTNRETIKIVQTIQNISLLAPTSRETITIVVPDNSRIYCYNDGNIGFRSQININKNNPPISSCPQDTCDKNYSSKSTLNCKVDYITGIQKIAITKNDNNISITRG